MQQLKSHVLSMFICWCTEEFLINTGTFDLSRQYTTHELAIPVKYSCNAGTVLQVKDGYLLYCIVLSSQHKNWETRMKAVCPLPTPLYTVLYCTVLDCTVPSYIYPLSVAMFQRCRVLARCPACSSALVSPAAVCLWSEVGVCGGCTMYRVQGAMRDTYYADQEEPRRQSNLVSTYSRYPVNYLQCSHNWD